MASELQTSEATPTGNIFDDRQFVLLFAAVMVLAIGVMMLIFSSAYVKDVQTLRNAPSAVWNFICGTPIDNNVTLPLLLTIAIVCFVSGGILLGLRWNMGRSSEKVIT